MFYPDREWFDKIELLVRTRGEGETRTICMEECAELVQAISKVMRAKTDAEKDQARTNLLMEIADVLISIDLLQVTEEIGSDEIMTAVDDKMVRNLERIKRLPSVQPEQRYTKEELSVFKHGISLSLLSKRSAQHWHYDQDTATEIKFLERLYEKVGADMRGEQE